MFHTSQTGNNHSILLVQGDTVFQHLYLVHIKLTIFADHQCYPVFNFTDLGV